MTPRPVLDDRTTTSPVARSVLRAGAFGMAAALIAAGLLAALVVVTGTGVALAHVAVGAAVGSAVAAGHARVAAGWRRALGLLLALFALLLSSYLVLGLHLGQGVGDAFTPPGEAAAALERHLHSAPWELLLWGLALVAGFCTAGGGGTGDDAESVQDVPPVTGPTEADGPVVTALAVCAMIAIFLIGLVGTGALDSPPVPDPRTQPGEAPTVAWDDLRPDTCVRVPSDVDWLQAVVVECTRPHNEEVMSSTTLDGPATWLGDDAMDAVTDAACGPVFAEYVGLAPTHSQLDYYTITPDRTAWDDGDHTLICMLYDPDRHELTGSLRGAAR